MTRPPSSLAAKLNWLRAGVLGANDGIVSTAGIVMGVAGATSSSQALLVAGLAGLVAGALSMAGGEYVSVSSQKDTELAAVDQVRDALKADPDQALAELTAIYEQRGLSHHLADQVASEYTAHDAIAAQTEARFGISAHEQTSPWAAALASFISFTLGALVPLLVMVLTPVDARVIATMAAVVVVLSMTGSAAAWLGHAHVLPAVARNCLVGVLTMGITYLVGHLVQVQL